MKINVFNENGLLTFNLEGRLDSTTAGDLETSFENELNENVNGLCVDLSLVDFVSSKGLRVLVAAYKKMAGRPMKIEKCNASVKEVFRLSGLQKIFDIQ